ncbi:aminotransferase class I/II-fold pyridoxal phosphate-dependent enzyme, partial [Pseudomonas canadensis]|uniref:aminotransferase class I/II-fold pyridoxal phosphate-dependent enzyme n=1 Tax=Pseudomonas canadensis TaxID=915099 RepID=UPI0030D90521
TVALLEKIDPPPDGLIVATPGNPTGTMLHPDEFAAITDWCVANGVRLISDEIYHGLHWGIPISTAVRVPGAVVINSFSKYFSMTGWRVGWMVVPEILVRPIERLQQNLSISVPSLSQIAAEAAFDGAAEMEAIKHGYQENRRILIEGLP